MIRNVLLIALDSPGMSKFKKSHGVTMDKFLSQIERSFEQEADIRANIIIVCKDIVRGAMKKQFNLIRLQE